MIIALSDCEYLDVQIQGDGNHTALSCDLTGQCYIWYYKEDRSYPVLCEWGDVSAKMAVAGRPYFVSGVNNDQTLIVYPVGYVQQIHSGRGQEISVNSLRIPIFGEHILKGLQAGSVVKEHLFSGYVR